MADQLASVDYMHALAVGAQDMLVKLHAHLTSNGCPVEALDINDSLRGVNNVTYMLAAEVKRLKEEKKRAAEGGA